MSKKPQNAGRPAAHTIVFGEERAARIRRFCARLESAPGGKRPTIPEAVNMLIDQALEVQELQIPVLPGN
jgi:hypothetical protein